MRQQITANDVAKINGYPPVPMSVHLNHGKDQIGLDEFKTRDLDNVLTKPSARSRLSLRLELLTSPIRCSISRAIAVERDRGTAFLCGAGLFRHRQHLLLYFATRACHRILRSAGHASGGARLACWKGAREPACFVWPWRLLLRAPPLPKRVHNSSTRR